MLYEERYMETWREICNKQKLQMESLRFTLDTNERIITFPNSIFAFWKYFRISDLKISLRELAELICPLDFIICKFNNKGYFLISKLTTKMKKDRSMTLSASMTQDGSTCAYISEKNIRHIYIHSADKSLLTPELESVVFNNAQFVRYLHWSARRNALMVAYKYKNGSFFHTLKWIALFL